MLLPNASGAKTKNPNTPRNENENQASAQNSLYIVVDCKVMQYVTVKTVLLSKRGDVSILQPNGFGKPAIFATISNMISVYFQLILIGMMPVKMYIGVIQNSCTPNRSNDVLY